MPTMPVCPGPTSSGPSPSLPPGPSLKTGTARSWQVMRGAWCSCAQTRRFPPPFPVSPPTRSGISRRAVCCPRRKLCPIFRRFSDTRGSFPFCSPFAPIRRVGLWPTWWAMWPKPGRTVRGAVLWEEWGWSVPLSVISGERTVCVFSRSTPGVSCGCGIPCRPSLRRPRRRCVFRWTFASRKWPTAFSGVGGVRR